MGRGATYDDLSKQREQEIDYGGTRTGRSEKSVVHGRHKKPAGSRSRLPGRCDVERCTPAAPEDCVIDKLGQGVCIPTSHCQSALSTRLWLTTEKRTPQFGVAKTSECIILAPSTLIPEPEL